MRAKIAASYNLSFEERQFREADIGSQAAVKGTMMAPTEFDLSTDQGEQR